jgi:hypothetical protein
MKTTKCMIIAAVSWILTLWISKIFIVSLFYKFANAPDTQHIFGTIGTWLATFFGETFGGLFSNYGGYVIGVFELITSLVLLSPAVFFFLKKMSIMEMVPSRKMLHSTGGIMATAVMTGAAFFHLVSPLGIEVLNEGQSDGGALFYMAVSIIFSGLILFVINGCFVGKKSLCGSSCS